MRCELYLNIQTFVTKDGLRLADNRIGELGMELMSFDDLIVRTGLDYGYTDCIICIYRNCA